MAAYALINHQFRTFEAGKAADGDVKTIQKVWAVRCRQCNLKYARILLTHWEPEIGIKGGEVIQLLLAQEGSFHSGPHRGFAQTCRQRRQTQAGRLESLPEQPSTGQDKLLVHASMQMECSIADTVLHGSCSTPMLHVLTCRATAPLIAYCQHGGK